MTCKKKVASSHLVIDVPPEEPEQDNPLRLKVHTDMVKEKGMESLTQFGGVKEVAALLQTDTKHGITNRSIDLNQRKDVFGVNMFQRQPPMRFLPFLLKAFKDKLIVLNLICAVLSMGFGIKQNGWKDGWYAGGGSSVLAIVFAVFISALCNFKLHRQFEELSTKGGDIKVEVVRDGRRQIISTCDVVVGDIVFLNTGDQVPADGLFLQGHSLKVDESSVTGESDHVHVNANINPFLLCGTKVTNGFAHMLVTSVGMNTAWGEMISLVTIDPDVQTPLQARLNKLTSDIGKAAVWAATLVLLVSITRYFTREFHGSKTKFEDVMNAIIGIIGDAITTVEVAIPEGLPLAVTLTLAFSMKKMIRDNGLIRELSACERIVSVTTICTDKTGTLTLNEMKVTEVWVGEQTIVEAREHLPQNIFQLLKEGIGLNTTGSIYQPQSNPLPETSGSPTEKALLSWGVLDLGINIDELKQNFKIIHMETFNSEKKRSGVLTRENRGDRIHSHWKGAAEVILTMCSNYYDQRGEIMIMDAEKRVQIEDIIKGMAAKSLRCIGLAQKSCTENNDGEVYQKVEETELVLLAILGLEDPCRPGVREVVESCRNAGVEIKMITGDNVHTARAIASESGILSPLEALDEEAVVEGYQFRNYTHEERMERIDKIRVMARSSPDDKLMMVQCLKQRGHVVAVTGDGTNDVPALKEADIGLSMGIQGTEVAKQSSDIVILDDNFHSVVTVLRWGRCVHANIQKFIQFQLTLNFVAVVMNFVAAVSSGKVPLTNVQLLWINLITYALGGLALATEQPTDDLMEMPPVGRLEPLITKVMWRNLIAQALYQVTVVLILQFKGKSMLHANEEGKDTFIFNVVVLCQVFNCFNAGKLEKKNIFEGLANNRLFMVIVGLTVAFQLVMVEFLHKYANTERLNWEQWGVCIGIAALSWPIDLLVKSIPVVLDNCQAII